MNIYIILYINIYFSNRFRSYTLQAKKRFVLLKLQILLNVWYEINEKVQKTLMTYYKCFRILDNSIFILSYVLYLWAVQQRSGKLVVNSVVEHLPARNGSRVLFLTEHGSLNLSLAINIAWELKTVGPALIWLP